VPSTRVGRLLSYSGLVAGIGLGALAEGFKRAVGASEGTSSVFVSEDNAERLVRTLSRMRGAALKLGQMISIQDNKSISPEIREILERVRLSADYMPQKQREKVMRAELGPDWRQSFRAFDDKPFSAASIGQVHRATTLAGDDVVVKVQYPGVAESISSDLGYLRSLLTASSFLPKGLFLDNTIKIAAIELGWECDYTREALYIDKFRGFLEGDRHFGVPFFVPELTSRRVITLEMMKGVSIDRVATMSQEVRDFVAEQILRLCLREMMDFRTMQTDPNWSNFLFDPAANRINLIDFGATREFSKEFMDKYVRLLQTAQTGDREACARWSTEIGFLTGEETKPMIEAHISACMILGEPFRTAGTVNFANQDMSGRVQELIPIMLRHRLKPPPDETYSLHRKLSGAFLLCTKLGARIDCKRVFDETFSQYHFV